MVVGFHRRDNPPAVRFRVPPHGTMYRRKQQVDQNDSSLPPPNYWFDVVAVVLVVVVAGPASMSFVAGATGAVVKAMLLLVDADNTDIREAAACRSHRPPLRYPTDRLYSEEKKKNDDDDDDGGGEGGKLHHDCPLAACRHHYYNHPPHPSHCC